MSEEIAYFDGEFVPAARAAVSVYDTGFVLGATIAEQLRTFGGKVFRRDEHLRRLTRSLEIVGVEPGLSTSEMAEIAARVVEHNHALLEEGSDLGLSIFVTPGPYAALAPEDVERRPLLAMHTYRLPFHLWANKYRTGEALATSRVRQVPGDCWPSELKCRSRMHYFLATRDVHARYPGAVPLLLDHDQYVCETPTANVVGYRRDEGFVTPRRDRVLPGVSLAMVAQLAGGSGIAWVERDLTVAELSTCDEVLITSTPYAILPVTTLDGRAIGTGKPGPVFERVLSQWSEAVGVDIARQAQNT
jgi:branched-subunit amino acid aminotransferase/4-amino-4-deoxychorismate lyase